MIRPASIIRKLLAVSAVLVCGATAASAQVDFYSRFPVSNSGWPVYLCGLQAGPPLSVMLQDRLSYRVRPRQQPIRVIQLDGPIVLVEWMVDQKLDDASTLLQARDWPGDVGCCAEMRRNGPLLVIGTREEGGMGTELTCGFSKVIIPAQTITTQAQVDAVLCASHSQARDVILVSRIFKCGDAEASSIGGFAGCASPGPAVFVRNDMSGKVWAHEFGHARGLRHRPLCGLNQCGDGVTAECNCNTAGDAARNVMFCTICSGAKDTISATECTMFQSGSLP